jgi:hypothetical protein
MKVGLLGKPYGINLMHHWEHLGEPFGNLIKTLLKHDGNALGTRKILP